ncbi:MAG: polysaccharide deacetylase family protein [Desulfovibrio sp.]|nr:polysaccharide deacetylase family protein [Desulfovibrio sp.]
MKVINGKECACLAFCMCFLKQTEKVCISFFFLFLLMYPSFSFSYSANEFLAEMDEPGLCALTFDDGPSQYTGHLLDMMEQEDVKATFFVLGENALRFPEMIKREQEAGHEVASHGWSHKNLAKASEEQIRNEVVKTIEVLDRLGIKPLFFRPPYGSFTEYVEEVVTQHDMQIALWTHDSLDWKRLPKSYAALTPRQTKEHRHGVFLFHDIHKKTVNDFPRIIRELRASGCQRFVTLSEYVAHIRKQEPKIAPSFYICMLLRSLFYHSDSYKGSLNEGDALFVNKQKNRGRNVRGERLRLR